MKMRNVVLLILLSLTVGVLQASAQPRRMSVDERVAMLKDTLHLSASQADTVRSIYTAADKEVQAAFTAAGEDRAAMRETMGKIREKTDKQIEAVLTAEQKNTYIELRKAQDLRRQQRQMQPPPEGGQHP
jgi:hypothetical protein